jgi:CRISPR-associated protein Cmr4
MNLTLFLYTESATHAGTGTGLGAVDLPIQREVTTLYPLIQGTGVKGALRHQYSGNDAVALFGPETNNASDHAGAIMVSDARLLAFPVRSLKGVMAWVTCPDVLARFQRDCGLAKNQQGNLLPIPTEPVVLEETEAYPASQDVVIDGGTIMLEEYAYRAKSDSTTEAWAKWLAEKALPNVNYEYYKNALAKRLIVLRNDDFRDFALYATQVVTRVKINPDSKTVETGMLFTQELLPADTLFYVPISTAKERLKQGTKDPQPRSDQDMARLLTAAFPEQNRIQIGGDETTGRGIVALRWS